VRVVRKCSATYRLDDPAGEQDTTVASQATPASVAPVPRTTTLARLERRRLIIVQTTIARGTGVKDALAIPELPPVVRARFRHLCGRARVGAVQDAVRIATRGDVQPIAESLALAFDDDPVMEFLFPNRDSRSGRLVRFFRTALLAQHLRHATCFTDAERAGAALWDPPGHWRVTFGQLLRAAPGFVAALGTRLPVGLRTLATVERVHPTVPHYYLAVLGTRPERQGRGLGSSLLQPVLRRCDEQGIGAYLESSKERNIPFYRRHGFEVTGEIRLPDGPLVWSMWRDPRPRA
jgi:ribosomal protein S18 acetylase RimI-like enzyme